MMMFVFISTNEQTFIPAHTVISMNVSLVPVTKPITCVVLLWFLSHHILCSTDVTRSMVALSQTV